MLSIPPLGGELWLGCRLKHRDPGTLVDLLTSLCGPELLLTFMFHVWSSEPPEASLVWF